MKCLSRCFGLVAALVCAGVSAAEIRNLPLVSAGFGVVPKQGTPVTKVSVDIKPGSCPNPLNVVQKGRFPVAVLGGESLDVRQIDVGTILLAGVAPIDVAYEDVAAPVAPDSGPCACTTQGPDGWLDLALKFSTVGIVEALGPVSDGEVISLTLTGSLLNEYGGRSFSGSDCVVIRAKGSPTK